MLGLLLIFFIGKYFYELAREHLRKPWPYALLGVLTYYVGTFIFGIAMAIISEIAAPGWIEGQSDILLNIIALPVGVLCCWLLYQLLKKRWIANPIGHNVREMIDQFGQKEEDRNFE